MSGSDPHVPPTPAGDWGGPPRPPPPPYPPPPYPPPPYQPPYQAYPSRYPGFPPPGGPPRRSRLPLVLGVVAAVLVLGVAVTVPLVLAGDDEPTSPPSGAPTDEPVPTDLSEVREYEDLPTTHVEESVPYEQSPPVGGPHYPVWLECGVYDEPVPDEAAVHDLEHGTFWFAYDAGALSAEEVAALAEQLPENGIMAPYEGIDAPVVVTVWERQLALTGVDDPRLGLFLDEYAGGETAPEPFASCAGGVSPDDLEDGVGA